METTLELKKNGKSKAPKKDVESVNLNRPTKQINLAQIDIKRATFKIVGLSPLIVNKFSEKAKEMMLAKQTGGSKERTLKNPEEQYLGSLYTFPDGERTGFPAVGFKGAMVRAGKQLGLPMTDTRGKFHVIAEAGTDLVEITGEHYKRDDMVRLATGVADIRFRGCYRDWSAKVTIAYNAAVISEEQLGQLINLAGFSCGVGEWRPEKSNSGSFGLFQVV